MNPPFELARAGDAHFSAAAIAEDLQTVRERPPLVHNVTNFVVVAEMASTAAFGPVATEVSAPITRSR